jgi:hypothetical protein
MRDAKELRRIGRNCLQHHAQATDAFSGDHTTNCQFHLRCPQSSIDERSVLAKFGAAFEGSVQGADLFAASIYGVSESGTLSAVFTTQRERFVPVVDSIARAGDA